MIDPAGIFNSRLKWMIVVACLFFCGIVWHLFNLQVVLSLNFYKLSRKNFLRYERIASPRGNIVDRFGNLLATNRPIRTIYWQGTGNRVLSRDQETLIANLTLLLDLSSDSVDAIAMAEKQACKLPLIEELTFEQLSKIIEQFPNNKNIYIGHQFKRYYPHESVASHIIGYIGHLNREFTGLMGLEMLFEDRLKGKPGQIIKTINSVGKHLSEQESEQALSGGTIETTLDLDLQLIAEDLFPKDESGSFVILDPQDGAILVLLSRPNFNPNIFLQAIGHQDWKSLQEKKCFINRALNACYPPASLFKLVSLSAALDEGIIDQNTTWYCMGHVNFGNRAYHCGNLRGHGELNAEQALVYSCNIPFFDIAKKIKIDMLADYAQRFGLGERTNKLLPEKAGLVPTSTWKRQIKNEPWWPGETLSAAIGQSFLLITPIQAACMVSAICQNYLVQPRILMSEPIMRRPLNIKASTIDFLKNSLQHVIRSGTGKSLNKLTNIQIFAKTGTAQTSDLSKKGLGKKFTEHGWLVAYFQYKEHKPLTMIVLIENIGSSKAAIATACNFLIKYCDLLDKRHDSSRIVQ